VAEFDLEFLRRLAAEVLISVHDHPEWITQDPHLRPELERLVSERILTPKAVVDIVWPLFEEHATLEEQDRASELFLDGHPEEAAAFIVGVLDERVPEQND